MGNEEVQVVFFSQWRGIAAEEGEEGEVAGLISATLFAVADISGGPAEGICVGRQNCLSDSDRVTGSQMEDLH
ncbi:hypothetical protein AMECASPLE_035247 [Ameca splendens]|uniref:Uncharacterized protein n=2 Tax=Goodeidae TaxID=28758 RepID=A0ABU7AS13_9TELE|nr:hypothetical protein [Ataeniobius toweri]